MDMMALRRSVITGSEIDTSHINPAVLQRIIAAGEAVSYYSIGDIIYIPWTDNSGNMPVEYQYPFVVVDIADCYDENDVLHHNGLWLETLYTVPYEIPFDAPEPNSPSTYQINTNGYNRWRDSAYRQWLNSDAAKNANWWTPQHATDAAPASQYTNLPGWLYGFTDEWKAIFKPVKVQTATNTVTDGGVTDITYDKFFLASLEQMYGVPQAPGIEGKYWPYWKEKTKLTEPYNGTISDTNAARFIPSIVDPYGNAMRCRMRSANRDTGSLVWYVRNIGFISNYGAQHAYSALPACVIY